MKTIFILLVILFTVDVLADSQIVEFVIKKGTLEGEWNTKDRPIEAKVGDTVRFINQDSIVHQLHTYNGICDHSPEIEPSTTWDCVTVGAWNSNDSKDGPLYDHLSRAHVWVHITP